MHNEISKKSNFQIIFDSFFSFFSYSSTKIGSYCIFQNDPSQGEWAKDANGKIIELNVNFARNVKCDDYENEGIAKYSDFYTVDIHSLKTLISSCNRLKQNLLNNKSSRESIQNQNIDLKDLDNYLSLQAKIIPQANDKNNSNILYPFAIQNQVRKDDFIFLSTYYVCK